MGGVQSSKRKIRRLKGVKCQSFEHFITKPATGTAAERNYNISIDENLEQVHVKFKLNLIRDEPEEPTKIEEQCKASSAGNLETDPNKNITKKRHLSTLRGCQSSSQLSSSITDKEHMFRYSTESLTDVTSMFTVESNSDCSLESQYLDIIKEKLRDKSCAQVCGELSKTQSHASTCSGSSCATAHGESLMSACDGRSTTEGNYQYLRRDTKALAGLVTRSCVDVTRTRHRPMRSHCSEDSGYLEDDATSSHISSCSNLSSLVGDTPAGKSIRRFWWKRKMSKNTSSSSLDSRKDRSILDTPRYQNCDYFKSELTGKVLSFRSAINGRLNIRNLPVPKQTAILVSALENFLFCKFRMSTDNKGMVSRWLRDTDNSLLQQGWQENLFISEQALILIYLLANDSGPGFEVLHIRDLKKLILTWSFVAYSYIGAEITYPISTFLMGESVDSFFRRCLFTSMHNSSLMLLLSQNRSYASSIYEGLLSYSQI